MENCSRHERLLEFHGVLVCGSSVGDFVSGGTVLFLPPSIIIKGEHGKLLTSCIEHVMRALSRT